MMEGADCSPQCRTVKGLAIASIGLSSVVVSSEISGGSDQGSDRAGSAARKLTDFCMTVLTNAVRRKIAEHETIVLSDRDRAVFFDALVKVGNRTDGNPFARPAPGDGNRPSRRSL
jgi:hypothetical protein